MIWSRPSRGVSPGSRRPFQPDVVVHDPQELTEGPQLRDADAVLPFLQQVPPDRELEAPLHAVDAVPRDRVAAAKLRRREHHPAPPRAAPVDEHLNSESKRKRIRVQ